MLATKIALRYVRAKQRTHFISFMSAIAFIGIALGVMVLITVLSVMNGFDQQIRSRILVMVPQITVTGWGGELSHWQSLSQKLEKNPKFSIVATAPLIQSQAMLSANGNNGYAMINGIDPSKTAQVSPLGKHMLSGSLKDLKPGHFNIILGKSLAESLGVTVGDKITLITPKTSLTPAGIMPRLKQFTVSGLFSIGYQFDNGYAFINLKDAQVLYQMKSAITGLQLKLTDLYLAPHVSQLISDDLNGPYTAYDWTYSNSNFFKALKMEKTMMFFILMLIIAVAVFNMLSSLVMMVTDKQSDIAILRTVGASKWLIMRIFMIQGTLIGLIGTLLGVILGVLLSWNVTPIVNAIQSLFHVQFLSASVYFIDFVPSEIIWSDVLHVTLIALVLSFLATLYPAYRAACVQPAEALRYE